MATDKQLFILEGAGTLLNRGCEAILRSTVSILRKEFGPCRFIHALAGAFPEETDREPDPDIRHLVPTKTVRWRPNWFLHQLRRGLGLHRREIFEPYLPEAVGTLAIGGDNYSLSYGVPRKRFHTNQVTLRHHKPLILWGASVGPFSENPEFEKWAAEELKKVSLICARESETVNYLAGLGLTDNVRKVSDPAFVLEPEPVTLTQEESDFLRQPCLGFNLSPLLAKYWQGKESWVEHAAACLRAILEKVDLPVVLVPHVVRFDNNDHAFLHKVRERLPEFSNRLLLIGPTYKASQLKWIISQMKVFIGARTHSTVAALSTCVPTVSIGYSMKARGINKDIFGHLDWLISFDQLQPDPLVDIAQRALSQGDAVRKELQGKMPAYKDRAWIAGRYVREVIDS